MAESGSEEVSVCLSIDVSSAAIRAPIKPRVIGLGKIRSSTSMRVVSSSPMRLVSEDSVVLSTAKKRFVVEFGMEK